MKFLIYGLLLFAFLFINCSISNFSGYEGEDSITPELIQRYVYYLASDSLKGRNTPGPELDSAAIYIGKEFKSWNLKPVNGSYLHKVNFGTVSLGNDNHLKIKKDNHEKSFQIKIEFTPFEMTANKEVTAPIVFAGYGITAPEYNYDDYKNLDVKDKIVFLLKHEPGEEDSSSVFDGRVATEYSENKKKVEIAIEHGAAGVLIATDPIHHSSLAPRGFSWPSLSKIIPKDALPLLLMEDEESKIPVVQVGEEVINFLFGSVDSLKKLQVKIDKQLSPVSFEFPGISINLKTTTEIKSTPAYNVVGFIEGNDPLHKDEIVVIGAHYDHVGYKKDHEPGADYIFNGAYDNASGTSSMMAIAAAFGTQKEKLGRSLLFIAFAGEEKGLLGSIAYVNHPLFPLAKTVAMLNLDMVGRNHFDSLQVIGVSRCPDLTKINEEENREIGFKFDYKHEKYLAQSDQASFLKKGIPVLFYCTGDTPEYHKVTDHSDLIDYKKAAKTAQLVFRTARHIANDTVYYKVTSKKVSLFQ